MRGLNLRRSGVVLAAAAPMLLAACGGGARQDANETRGQYQVKVLTASFPAVQSLAQHSQLVLELRNSGSNTIPDIAVTILDAKYGTQAQAFATTISGSDLASRSRPVWVIDKPPGPCLYSCRQGGPGSAVTAYSNTWALGKLAPRHTVKFVWVLTAVKSGHYQVRYEVAAGLNGRAQAIDSSGKQPTGTFTVTVNHHPQQSYVNNAGQIVTLK
ncbi:MAG: hypothetical protein ACYDHH_03925 [Solirubrobacteraceae bacterium]